MKTLKYRIAFYGLIIVAITPIMSFLFISFFYHQLTGCPQVENQVLDLKGYDFSEGEEIPLDGKWELFNDRWIVTQKESATAEADSFVFIPSFGNEDTLPRLFTPRSKRISSYRITLSNAPSDTELYVYIPRLNSSYRVFLNGKLVSGKGDMNIGGKTYEESVRRNAIYHFSAFYSRYDSGSGGELELVIEMTEPANGKMHMTPVLTTYSSFHTRDNLRQMIAAGITGILFITIARVCISLFGKDKTFASLTLLGMDVLIFFRIMFLNEYLSFLINFVWLRDYVNDLFLQTVTLLLPIAFLFCTQQLLQVSLDKKLVRFIFQYELCFCPFILYSAYYDLPYLLLLLRLFCYAPFLLVLHELYQQIKKGTPNTLLVSSILISIISSLLVSSLNASGVLLRDESLFAPSCFMVSMLLQFWMYLKYSLFLQKMAVDGAILQLQLKESETKLMLSQIKPHFLYNSLIAIHMLCRVEPEKAAETILKFATFLRTNMNFINSKEPIPFQKELEHIRNYVDMEKLRFHDRIHVYYDIKSVDFCVPSLSIQPLVENAIRHGACKKIEGGNVWIEVFESEEKTVVRIRDDGPGFNFEQCEREKSELHGLQNVRFRLTQQMKADFAIETAPGEGTAVIVSIPKGGNG